MPAMVEGRQVETPLEYQRRIGLERAAQDAPRMAQRQARAARAAEVAARPVWELLRLNRSFRMENPAGEGMVTCKADTLVLRLNREEGMRMLLMPHIPRQEDLEPGECIIGERMLGEHMIFASENLVYGVPDDFLKPAEDGLLPCDCPICGKGTPGKHRTYMAAGGVQPILVCDDHQSKTGWGPGY